MWNRLIDWRKVLHISLNTKYVISEMLFPTDLLTSTEKTKTKTRKKPKQECGPIPNVMAALPNTGGALCSMPQSLADAHYYSAVQ